MEQEESGITVKSFNVRYFPEAAKLPGYTAILIKLLILLAYGVTASRLVIIDKQPGYFVLALISVVFLGSQITQCLKLLILTFQRRRLERKLIALQRDGE